MTNSEKVDDVTEQCSSGTERFDYRGITHCYPHNNEMPCAKCARAIKRSLETATDRSGVQ